MSFVNMSVLGVAETVAKFAALAAAAEEANKVGLEAAGETVLAKAKRLAPVSDEETHGSPPGYLRDHTIAKFENGSEYVGTIDTPYARFMEYGFHHFGSGDFIIRPYLRPAANGAQPEVLSAYSIVLGAAIRAVVGI